MYYGSYELRAIAEKLVVALEAGLSYEETLILHPGVKSFVKDHSSSVAARKRSLKTELENAKKKIEKQKEEDMLRAEIVKKLTPEERAAFGLDAKGRRKTKS